MSSSKAKRSVTFRGISIRRGPLAITTLAVALVVTGMAFALGNTGVVSTNIQPAPGVPPSGSVASTDTSIATSVTRSQGNAQLQTGVTLARIEVAPSFATKLRVSVFWTDPYDAGKALNNPNAQISVGIYNPIHTGTCTTSATSTVAQYVTVTDGSTSGTANTYCSRLDTTATGSSSVSSEGKLLITKRLPGGYLLPTTPAPSNLAGCSSLGSQTESSLPWCEPTATAAGSLTTSGPLVMYVVASVLVPGGAPIGQKATLSSLHFFVDALSG